MKISKFFLNLIIVAYLILLPACARKMKGSCNSFADWWGGILSPKN